ncbi:hypothetical protein BH18ACT3_BH18ACT3_28070 [soil metagenome]|jgi:hypothetical protein
MSMAALGVFAGACGGEEATANAEEFCAEVDTNKEAIIAPKLRTDADVRAFVDLHRRLGELAPLAIEQEWNDVTSNYETAATIDPDDPESVERAKSKAYATERSAVGVRDWLRATCRVNLGPVTTIVPQRAPTAPAPTATTTTPG